MTSGHAPSPSGSIGEIAGLHSITAIPNPAEATHLGGPVSLANCDMRTLSVCM